MTAFCKGYKPLDRKKMMLNFFANLRKGPYQEKGPHMM